MPNIKIAIHSNLKGLLHSTSWIKPWIEYCTLNNIHHEIINCFESNSFLRLKEFDILLWHFGNYSPQGMLFARSILAAAQNMGLKVFPDYNTSWHFDDKIAQYYLLMSENAPMPASWIFYSQEECIDWLKRYGKFPLVAKLRVGSGSNNVRLLRSQLEAIKYSRRMFQTGFRNIPGLYFKAKSNIQSVNNLNTFIKRFKRIPEFFRTYRHSRLLPRELGYTYFQEFVPNKGFDVKIVVIGDKISFAARTVRKDDFRASGSGSLFYDKSLIPDNIIISAFSLSDRLGFQVMGYDYIIDSQTNQGKIVELSYGFSSEAILNASGYWDKSGKWFNEPLNVPSEIIKNLIKQI